MKKITTKPNSDSYAEVEQESNKFRLVFFRRPVPASRPRVTRWSTYYLKTYTAYRTDADKAIPQSEQPPLQGNLKAHVSIVAYKPKTTKLTTPRGDIDNHVKAIFDAITGHNKDSKGKKLEPKGYWIDDAQVSELYVTKRFAEPGETPHTEVTVSEL